MSNFISWCKSVAAEIEHVIWIPADEIICVSWKTGQNVEKVLDAIIEKIDSPEIHKSKNPKKFYIQKEDKD